MTGIAQRKAQWEQEAREDERRQIVEWLRMKMQNAPVWTNFDEGRLWEREVSAGEIERGEYRKAKSE